MDGPGGDVSAFEWDGDEAHAYYPSSIRDSLQDSFAEVKVMTRVAVKVVRALPKEWLNPGP